MKIYLRLAFRNLLRHRRRTLVCLGMIISAFCALVAFHGFSRHALDALEAGAVDSIYGNLQVAKQSYFDRSPVKNPRDVFLANPDTLIERLSGIPGVTDVSGRLSFFSLLSNSDQSVSGRGIGLEVAKEKSIWKHMLILDGEKFSATSNREILIGHGLNKAIHAKPGDRLSLVTSTLDGTVNGIDVTVRGIFAIGITEIDDFVFFIPHQAARHLIDADSFETLFIKTRPEIAAEDMREHVIAAVKDEGLTVKTWRELAILFLQVEQFWDTQNLIILSILGVLIFLGIANTVSMTIMERTSEIGTLRAIGFEKRDLKIIFLLESVLMGVAGILLSLPVSLLVILLVNSSGASIMLPTASFPLEIKILFTKAGFGQAIFTSIAVPFIATLPALRQILKKSIVDSLRVGS